MHVVVELYGPLQRFASGAKRRVEMEVQDGISVTDLLVELGVDILEPWNASLNGTLASPTDTVTEGAFIIVFPPISGG
jgi:molybdopterin converting factor small subunit